MSSMRWPPRAGCTLSRRRTACGSGRWTWRRSSAARCPLRGFSPSPLVDGDLVLLEAGGTEGKAVVALDKKTGKLRWSALNGRPGYVTPLAVTIDGVRQYVFVRTAEGDILSLLPDGKVHWQHPWKKGAIASPLFV